jgi:hypothetical protein
MNVIGWALAGIGFLGALVGLLEMLKRKKMQRVPFLSPGDIATKGRAAADVKGWVSTEGRAATAQPLTAPLSGKACLAYEIDIVRHYEKIEQTENGSSTKKGTDKIHTIYNGTIFQVGDANGHVLVDVSDNKPDTTLAKSKSEKIKVGIIIPGALQFGSLQINTPSVANREGATVAFEATETVLELADTMYAMGQLKDDAATPTLTKSTLSNKGRHKLLSATKRNMILGYAVGGALLVGGTGLGIFGPKGSSCSVVKGEVACTDKLSDRERDLSWTVETAGTYEVSLAPNVNKSRVREVLSLFSSTGERLGFDVADEMNEPAHVKVELQPGTYRINVSDTGAWLKGGRSYKLLTKRVGDIAKPVVAAAEPSVPASCEKAADCCDALNNGKSKTSCDAYRAATDATCSQSLVSMRKSARKNRAARSVCN